MPPPIISGFGAWQGGEGRARAWQHYGIDIRVPTGTPVLAAAAGTVARVGEHPNAGRLVVVAHAGDLATVYWHLSEIQVRVGQEVARGEALGLAGMTGNATTPHLHFGLCRHPAGLCGSRLEAGWDDPTRHWVDGTPCFVAERPYPADPVRLTYPVPCS